LAETSPLTKIPSTNYRNDLHEKELQDNGKIHTTELIEAELIDRINHFPENLKMISNPALDE
jgi:hypothetical protein